MKDRASGGVRAPAFLALSCIGFLSSPALADSTDATTAQSDVEQRRDIVITGERSQQPRLESPKATSDLLDTPQTITVLTSEQIRQQNLLSLRDALTTLPGITFGAPGSALIRPTVPTCRPGTLVTTRFTAWINFAAASNAS